MNILLICDEYPPGRHGGIGSAVKLQAHALARLGHGVFVAGLYEWGYGGDDYFEDGDVKVYRYRMGLASEVFKKQDTLPVRALYKLFELTGVFHWDIKRSLKAYQKKIEALIAKHSIDIVEMPDFHNYRRYCKSFIQPLSFSVPTIIKVHGSITYIAKENNHPLLQQIFDMEKAMFERADAICSVSKYGGQKVLQHLKLNVPFDVIYNGIDTQKLTPIEEKDETKVIFTGTLNENKGIYQLMKAWNFVVAKNNAAKLDVYGKGPVERIKKLLNADAINSVSFLGHVDHKKLFHELGTASVCIFPSYAENFALGPMEAMASGAAVIYTKRASGPELIDNGVDGILVDPDDVEDMSDKILLLLSDKVLRNSIATAGKNKVVEHFDINVIAQKHVEYYQSVLEKM